jgi:AAA domain
MRARFSVSLNLPEGEQQHVNDAAEAVRKEYRNSVRWKRLRCRKVQPLSEQPGESIFIIEIGRSIEFDWTWEGAIAFRPVDPNMFTDDINVTDDFVNLASTGGMANGVNADWAGEIVEVDETNGRLFVSISSADRPPCTGTFFVRPFEFLAFLHSTFCQSGEYDFKSQLAPRLKASCGGIHPNVSGPSTSTLDELRQIWGHSWAILWGPPGTGKTHTLGRQVAGFLNDQNERILVLSTTNRATDAAALAVGRAVLSATPSSIEDGRILRLGKGATWTDYEKHSLTGLLRGTETEILRQIGALTRQLEKASTPEDRAVLRKQIQELRRAMKESAFNIFVSPDVQIVIGTAFKAITLLNHPEIRMMVSSGHSPFTTIVIDEARLISRAVVSVLSLLASRRVVIVGDAKQLAPISKVSRILPTSQAIWLGSSSLSHLHSVQQIKPGVHMLREQHRMHPDVSRVVSHFQYDGALQDAISVRTRQAVFSSHVHGQPRAIWYVLDEDCQDIASIRA